jgi:glycosyltransferase involved in cell wall biosynthesis
MSAVEVTTGNETLPLRSLRLLVITSGHEVNDSRVYGREAKSMRALGAEVTIVGKLERGTAEGVRTLLVPPAGSRLSRFLIQPWRCLWRARKEKADVIHYHDAEMLATLPVARLWWRKAKFVYDVHEDFANLMLIRDWLPRLMKPAVHAATEGFERLFTRFVDGIVGVTPPLAEKFARPYEVVVYNFVPGEFFGRAASSSRPPRDREFDLAHLGTLSSRRAIFLAETLTEFHRLRPAARSIVLGASADILALLKGRVPSACTLLGKVPYSEVAGYLGNAKVGLDVHPWLGPHLEVAVPVKVCEYMASGCGVVSSSMPILDRILRDAGPDADAATIIRGGEPAEYAFAAARTLEAIDGGANPGATLQSLARRHMNWDTEARKLAQFYLELVGS